MLEPARRLAVRRSEEVQDLRGRLIRVGRDSFRHVKEAFLTSGRRQKRDLPSYLAGIGGEQTGNTFEQCRLGCTIRPDQPQDLARHDIKGYVGEHWLIADRLADAT